MRLEPFLGGQCQIPGTILTAYRLSMHLVRALVLIAVSALAAPGGASAQQNPYSVTRNRIASAMQPNVHIDVDTALHYVGSQRGLLYDVAQAEQHLFVQRSPEGVERFLWVQFEEYIPSSNGRYDYSKECFRHKCSMSVSSICQAPLGDVSSW